MSNECSAYRKGAGICANGFFQTLACKKETSCHACNRPHGSVPHCMRDDLPEHWLTETGAPLFYQHHARTRMEEAAGSE